MALKQRLGSAYGISDSLVSVFPFPIKARRNPTTTDRAEPGTIWTNTANNNVFVLASTTNNTSNWLNVSGGAGDFDSLTVDPGPVDINGNMTVDGATFSLDSTTASNVTVTGAGQDLTLSSVGGSVSIEGTEASTSAIHMDASDAAGGIRMEAGDIIQLTTNTTDGNISLLSNKVTTAGAAATVNSFMGTSVHTGLTTASGATEVITITNSKMLLVDDGAIVTASNDGANDAKMTIERVIPAVGSITVHLKNNGAAALNGNLIITFMIIT